ncbi:MAG: hypothetical protein FWE42_02845 [Defluviitaleaceae bacterium]|nr:hypothetical protein [Defluviitaleaceae bacterium]
MKNKIAAFTLILVTFFIIFPPMKIEYSEEIITHPGSDYMQEFIVDGKIVRYPLSWQMEAAITSQELISVGGVPVLITTYNFDDGFEYEVFRLMQYNEYGELDLLPTEQVVEAPFFAEALEAFYTSHFGVGRNVLLDACSHGCQDRGAGVVTATGQYGGWRGMAAPIPHNPNVLYGIGINFCWQMGDNTNVGNLLWDWQRVDVRGFEVLILPEAHAAQNLMGIGVVIAARTHSMPGVWYSFSLSGLLPDVPSYPLTSALKTRGDFSNAAGVVVRINPQGWLNLDRAIPIPFHQFPGYEDWVSLDAFASFHLFSGFYSGFLRTGVTFRRDFWRWRDPLGVVSYVQ